MNCFNHNDLVAVSACQNCGVGLCSECVTNAVKIDNKPICKSCDLMRIESYIAELKNYLNQIKTKKIIWTVLLVIGSFFCLGALFSPEGDGWAVFLFLAFFIWGFGGFLARVERRAEFENSAAGVRSAIYEREMHRDGSIWVVWAFKFAFFLLRGAFFPIFYAHLMIFGTKKIEDELKECEEYKNNL